MGESRTPHRNALAGYWARAVRTATPRGAGPADRITSQSRSRSTWRRATYRNAALMTRPIQNFQSKARLNPAPPLKGLEEVPGRLNVPGNLIGKVIDPAEGHFIPQAFKEIDTNGFSDQVP